MIPSWTLDTKKGKIWHILFCLSKLSTNTLPLVSDVNFGAFVSYLRIINVRSFRCFAGAPHHGVVLPILPGFFKVATHKLFASTSTRKNSVLFHIGFNHVEKE